MSTLLQSMIMIDQAANMILRSMWALGLALLVAAPAQDLPPDEFRALTRPYVYRDAGAIRIAADMVVLRAVVRDSSGKPVRGLKKADFEVRDNGKAQPLKIFLEEAAPDEKEAPARESFDPAELRAPPGRRYLALFFDDLNMPLADLVPARAAAVDFVKQRAGRNDHLALFTSSQLVAQDFTTDHVKILEKLARLRSQFRRPDDGPGTCPHIGPLLAHQIVRLNDRSALTVAIEMARNCPSNRVIGLAGDETRTLAANVERQADWTLSMAEKYADDTFSTFFRVLEHMGKMPGEKVLLLLSSGFWSRSVQREKQAATELALRKQVIINSLDAKGLTTDSPDLSNGPPNFLVRRPELQMSADQFSRQEREESTDAISALALETGGQFFHDNNDIQRGVRELGEVPHAYMLGFAPEAIKPNGSFHKLQVRLPGAKGATVRTREGYYAPTRWELARRDPFDDVVAASTALQQISTGITEQVEKSAAGEVTLRVKLRLDLSSLPFQKKNDRRVDRVRYAVVVFDATGAFLAGSQAMFYFSLKDASLARLQREGFEQGISIQLPPGSYTVRHVVQEAMQGKMFAVTRPVAAH